MEWYILNVVAGHENSVKQSIIEKLSKNNFDEYVEEVFVPSCKIPKIRRGKRIFVESKVCPGYIFMKMSMNEKVISVIKGIDSVAKFLGSGLPSIVEEEEVENIRKFIEESENELTRTNSNAYETGELLKIVSGPFEGLFARVESIDEQKAQLSVVVSILGRETPIALDFHNVIKV